MNYESEAFWNNTKFEGRYPNYFKVCSNNFEFVLRTRSKITWHFCIPTSPYLSLIFTRKNLRNSPLFLRFCSIRLMKSTANSGANSTNLFLTEPLTSTSFILKTNTHSFTPESSPDCLNQFDYLKGGFQCQSHHK